MSTSFAKHRSPRIPEYSQRAHDYHLIRLYTSCGVSLLSPLPSQARMAASSSPSSSASFRRFPNLSLLRSNLPAIVPIPSSDPSTHTVDDTSGEISSLSSSQQSPGLCSSRSTDSPLSSLESSLHTSRPPLRSVPRCFYSYNPSHHSSASSSSSCTSSSSYSSTTNPTALPTPNSEVYLSVPVPQGHDPGLEFEDDEEEKLFRLTVSMREGEFDGDMEADSRSSTMDQFDAGMDGTETMEMK